MMECWSIGLSALHDSITPPLRLAVLQQNQDA